jgi:hypothetical protein
MFRAIAISLLVVFAVLAFVTLVEFALGFLVALKGGRRLPAWLLAVYLWLQPFTVGMILLQANVNSPEFKFKGFITELTGWKANELAFFAFVGISLLPALLVAFSLAYPTIPQRLRGRTWLLAALFLPGAALAIVALFSGAFRGGASASSSTLAQTLLLLDASLFTLGNATAAAIFWRRAAVSSTELEAKRLRYMRNLVAAPLAIAMLALILTVIINGATKSSDIAFLIVLAFVGFFLAILVLVPAFGMAYGLLKYRILEFDTIVKSGVRFTISRSVIAAVFLTVFFAVSEGTQAFIQNRTNSTIVGIIGASLLLFAIAPLEHLSHKLARRALPAAHDEEKYREFRRWEVYRATFEEFATDKRISTRERRALASLAKSLGLKDRDVATIESQVRKEQGFAKPAG